MPSEEQILVGVTQNNSDTLQQCTPYNDKTEEVQVTVTGLAPATTYQVYCLAYNDYPLWPQSYVTSDDVTVPNFAVTTKSFSDIEQEDDDYSTVTGLTLLLLALVAQ